jgi:hypothetical protein
MQYVSSMERHLNSAADIDVAMFSAAELGTTYLYRKRVWKSSRRPTAGLSLLVKYQASRIDRDDQIDCLEGVVKIKFTAAVDIAVHTS